MNLQIVLSFLLGGSFLGFIQFMITRSDNKNNEIKEVMNAINLFKDEFNKKIESVQNDVRCIKHTEARERAIEKRVRILHFEDGLQEGRKHSKDSFDQVLSDITDYEEYCSDHPKFKNNQTAATVEHIKSIYQERLEKRDFS